MTITIDECPTCGGPARIDTTADGPVAVCALHGRLRWVARLTYHDYASDAARRLLAGLGKRGGRRA